ncbi:RNA polymerase sigma factor [Pseudodesulfovibrio piezophilus]|uniref:RNA polymerase, sigma-24 subunit, ECF subfamily n=1 Tax=Pseudodesulfovibrio piezophilus (strain DSM 21447 / JCM 15486 / C1TLV30) TaxID=1322246 RepID=M1WRW7_PSEP2|nr:RNA polymerase sigma factor [Pseudodesulfovibrio piezophilus]CCH48567.1 RNA polymerase, sigma-24 subunit, ECF subfamily [Pseudodesulfovibrio piezophilus C1TLV30]
MPGKPDDMALITEIISGDTNAFKFLLERYEIRVARIVAAHVPPEHVAEVSHETFIRAFKSLHGYSPVKPFLNWLTTIATRSCHDFWRDHYRRKESLTCDLSLDGQRFMETALAEESKDKFDSLVRQREAQELLALLLDQLAPMDRMVLTLTYLEERSTKETAAMLDISVPNVKVRSFRAKRKLKSFLKRNGIQGGAHDS